MEKLLKDSMLVIKIWRTPNLQQKQMQFLYDDGEFLQFMDNEPLAEGFNL